MSEFEVSRTLATHLSFTLLEAHSKKLGFPVVLKRCRCSNESEAEFFIRSALLKTKNKVYSQPPLSILADLDHTAGKTIITFVWRKSDSMDQEIEVDQDLQLASGSSGYSKRAIIHMNASTGESVEKAKCLSLDRKVVIKAFRRVSVMELNLCFEEALAIAKCFHSNICEFLDFRLFQAEDGGSCAYIVMERLEQDLGTEVRKRKSMGQRYTDKELLDILADVAAGLLHAKSLNIAHRDIKPANILRSSQGLKLGDFGSTWQKGLNSETASAKGTIPYLSPETWATMNNSELLQRPFESDIFSLGVTMLHIAALELPQRTADDREQEGQFRRAVDGLQCSEELGQLLLAMLSIDPRNRPTLEVVHERAQGTRQVQSSDTSVYKPEAKIPLREVPTREKPSLVSEASIQVYRQQADQLLQRAKLRLNEENYATAAELCASANATYSLYFPEDKCTADNLRYWAASLSVMENSEEAVEKFEAADAIYSRHFPNDKDTADNLCSWGLTLRLMNNSEEAAQKHAAADAILSRFFQNEKETAYNLTKWGIALSTIGNDAEAVRAYVRADDIYSRLFPDDQGAAFNLCNWGISLRKIGKEAQAAKTHSAADKIYSRLYPNEKGTADNLRNWGCSLYEMEKYAEATIKYAAAGYLYSSLFPNCYDAANNLWSWALALKSMRQLTDAARKFKEAETIYTSIGQEDDALLCEEEIDSLR